MASCSRARSGPWYSPDTGDFHVSTAAAHDLVLKAINAYKDANNQTPPRELFLHGRVKFNWEEWRGFEQAAKTTNTAVVGVKIRDASGIKLYRWGDNPVLRGTALVQADRSAFLWTRGWTPRLQTYVGRGVPNPLSVDVTHGEASIKTVLQDVLALTQAELQRLRFCGRGAHYAEVRRSRRGGAHGRTPRARRSVAVHVLHLSERVRRRKKATLVSGAPLRIVAASWPQSACSAANDASAMS